MPLPLVSCSWMYRPAGPDPLGGPATSHLAPALHAPPRYASALDTAALDTAAQRRPSSSSDSGCIRNAGPETGRPAMQAPPTSQPVGPPAPPPSPPPPPPLPDPR